jgi:hypothetical protein
MFIAVFIFRRERTNYFSHETKKIIRRKKKINSNIIHYDIFKIFFIIIIFLIIVNIIYFAQINFFSLIILHIRCKYITIKQLKDSVDFFSHFFLLF